MRISASAFAAAALACSVAFAGPEHGHAGLDRAGFDTAVRPQDDLFDAVNGRWLRDTPIPADKSRWGAFIGLRDQSDRRARDIAEALAAGRQADGSDEQKIAAFYRAMADEAAIDRAGLAAAAPWLAQIDAIDGPTTLAETMGRLQGIAAMPMAAVVAPDRRQPLTYGVTVGQAGLGLPSREYYLPEHAHFEKARTAYLAYLERLFGLAGEADPQAAARTVFALEQRLAQAQWPRVDNRDPLRTYNPMAVAALAEQAPGFDWTAFLRAAALAGTMRLSVSQPPYATAFAAAADTVPLAHWKLYLRARLLDSAAPALPKPYRDAHFALHGQALRGEREQPPRWQVATGALNAALGNAVGRIYVARHFPPAHKARMQRMVGHLVEAYGASIDGLAWMSPETKRRARDKLARMVPKIGYPDVWRDTAGLDTRDGDPLGNTWRAGRFEHERRAARAGAAVDRREWFTTPQTVNAFYSAVNNEIVFPAGILEPPFFDPAADDAVNYGAIGAIIGHEISHGFDDSGSRYDGDGKLENWWTDADRRAFEALGTKLVAQYAAYEPIPGHKVNGRLTLGENIADLSGLQIAHKAYRLSLGGQPAPVIDGLTGDQRFFLAYAQAWRTKTRDERALQLLTSDTHSPERFRANGAAENHDAFHDAFGTRAGDAMWKPSDARIRIW